MMGHAKLLLYRISFNNGYHQHCKSISLPSPDQQARKHLEFRP